MYIIISIIAVILDQITKNYAVNNLKGKDPIELIPNWLNLTYVENKGAAFGMLNTKPMFFTIIASVFVIVMIYILFKNRNSFDSFYKFTLAIIIAGALGNLIDRLRYGYVVDFIFTPLGGLYDFPVFNLADVYLSVSAVILAIYILFFEGNIDEHK